MLDKKQITEIREFLESAQYPLFFFDNDADGLCSYAILQRSIGRGHGIPIKSYPELSSQYFKKVNEYNPDIVFILDKAEVSEGFINNVTSRNIPIVWIDHHPTKTSESLIRKTNYYNVGENCEPVTYAAQKIFNKQENLFLAVIGCISDVYMPDFADKFCKNYPELFNMSLSAFDSLHLTELGKIVRMINFGLMDNSTNVSKLISFVEEAKGPCDFLEENSMTKDFHKRYDTLNAELNKLVLKAEKVNNNSNILLFSYEGKTSMSAILSNQLFFNYPDKTIVVAYKKPDKINLSIRGHKALEITKIITDNIVGATGGGHKEATGAMIPTTKLDKLKKIINELNK